MSVKQQAEHLRVQFLSISGGAIWQSAATNRVADEAQGGEADGGRHPAHLAVLALVDLQLDPRGRDVGPVPDRGCALPRWRVVRQEPGFGGAGGEDLAFGLQLHRALERAEVFRSGGAFDLNVVGLPDFAAAVAFEDAALQVVVVG